MACKPTEQNYKNAYDIALKKKEQQKQSADGTVKDFTAVAGPHKEKVGNREVYVSDVRVKTVDKDSAPDEGRLGVAISKFGMITNARRQANDLLESEPAVFVAVDGDSNYYVLIGRCDDISEAADIADDFMSRHPDYPFIGLPDSPVAVMVW